ncbi:MAG: universal stress protein [Chloroflexota bacterium]
MSYSRIIVPLDGSALGYGALPFATSIAQAADATIELVHFIPPDERAREAAEQARGHPWAHPQFRVWRDPGPPYMSTFSIDPAPHRREDEMEARKWLDGVARGLRESNRVAVETAVPVGDPAEELVTIADRRRDDNVLIAMSTHGRTGLARGVMGSVTDRVMRESESPVLVVETREAPQDQQWQPERVVLPLDTSSLSEAAIPHAITMARSFDVPVMPCSVVPPGERDQEGKIRGYLEQIEERLRSDDLQVEAQLRQGEAADEILEVAANTRYAMIAMSTRGLSGLKRLVLGSVTDRVIRDTTVPVLVITPEEEH